MLSAAETDSSVSTFTDDTFERAVLASELPVLVDFTADWCPPCRVMAPIVAGFARARAGRIRVGRLDVDTNGITAQRYEIHSLPTLLVFDGGRVVGLIIGAVPGALLAEAVDRALAAPRSA